jgi:hypothetical protein
LALGPNRSGNAPVHSVFESLSRYPNVQYFRSKKFIGAKALSSLQVMAGFRYFGYVYVTGFKFGGMRYPV